MRSVFTFIFLFSISIPGFSQAIYYLLENYPVDNLSLSIMSNGSVLIKNTTEGTYCHFNFLLKGKKGSVMRRGPLHSESVHPAWYPGPQGNAYTQAYDTRYRRVWKLTAEEIQNHRAHYNEAGYQLPEVIENWPAHGNTGNGEPAAMAPYIDTNNNGSYDPAQGDYPAIKGDAGIFLILNSARESSYTSDSLNIRTDLYLSLYTKNGSHSVYMDMQLRNREQETLEELEASVALFSDFKNPGTHYYTDSLLHTVFVADSTEITNEVRRFGFTYFCAHTLRSSMPVTRPDLTNPQAGYRSLPLIHALNGRWPQGSALYLPPNVENGSVPASFFMPYGMPESDLDIPQKLSGVLATTRTEASIAPGAATYIRGVFHSTLESMPVHYNQPEALLSQAQQRRYSAASGADCLAYLSADEASPTQDLLQLYPNPAAELVQIDGITDNATLLLSDLYGRTFQLPLQNGRADISALAAGMYVVRIQQKEQVYNGGKLIIAR